MASHIGYLIKSINDKTKQYADADLKNHDLTFSQSRVLIYLIQKGGTGTQKEIEDFLNVSHPTVVGLVARMRKTGFLITKQDLKGNRSTIVKLTEQAFKTGKIMDASIMEMEKKMLHPLTDTEVDQLTHMLELILDHME